MRISDSFWWKLPETLWADPNFLWGLWDVAMRLACAYGQLWSTEEGAEILQLFFPADKTEIGGTYPDLPFQGLRAMQGNFPTKHGPDRPGFNNYHQRLGAQELVMEFSSSEVGEARSHGMPWPCLIKKGYFCWWQDKKAEWAWYHSMSWFILPLWLNGINRKNRCFSQIGLNEDLQLGGRGKALCLEVHSPWDRLEPCISWSKPADMGYHTQRHSIEKIPAIFLQSAWSFPYVLFISLQSRI